MKQVLQNPILVPIEINLIDDIIKIIGQSVHKVLTNDEVNAFKQHLINKTQAAIKENQKEENTT